MLTAKHSNSTNNRRTAVLAKRMFLAVTLLIPAAVWSAELIMIEQDDCHYCMVFDKEILPGYEASAEGKLAPLRRVNLAEEWPKDLSNINRDRLTPTFVLVEDNKEYGRLRGYPGKDNFWKLLQEMLARLPK